MNSLVVLIAAALMALVAVVCTAMWIAWSIPSWRRRLSRPVGLPEAGAAKPAGFTGWPERVGSGVVSVGIAACAGVAWYGCYCVLSELGGFSR